MQRETESAIGRRLRRVDSRCRWKNGGCGALRSVKQSMVE